MSFEQAMRELGAAGEAPVATFYRPRMTGDGRWAAAVDVASPYGLVRLLAIGKTEPLARALARLLAAATNRVKGWDAQAAADAVGALERQATQYTDTQLAAATRQLQRWRRGMRRKAMPLADLGEQMARLERDVRRVQKKAVGSWGIFPTKAKPKPQER